MLSIDSDISALQAVSGNWGQFYRTEVNGAAFWTPDAGLFYTDIAHSLNQKYVLAQYYDPDSDESILVDHHEFINTNTLRVYVSTSGNLGIIISG